MSTQFQPPVVVMRREQFTLDVTDIDWVGGDADPCIPCLQIRFHGDADTLSSRFEGAHGGPLDAIDIDVTVRLQGDVEVAGTHGIVAITSRVTGDYLLEGGLAADNVIAFIRAARRFGDHTEGTSRYLVRLLAEGDAISEHEKHTLLVYSHDGDLLRHHSLIPSGVEV